MAALPHRVTQPNPTSSQQPHSSVRSARAETTGRAECGAESVMANGCVHCDVFAKQWPVNSKKYAAMPCFLIQGFENGFQDCWNKWWTFLYISAPFSVNMNTLPVNFQVECIELRSDIHLRNLTLSLYHALISPLLPEREIPPPSQTHLIRVTTFGQHVHLWTTVFKA